MRTGTEGQLWTLFIHRFKTSGMSQGELARKAEMSAKSVSDIINGKCGLRPATADKFMKAMGCRYEVAVKSIY